MNNEVLLALILKAVDKKLQAEFNNLPTPARGLRGPRGEEGLPGTPGKDFSIEEHGDKIKSWIKESALKFSDLTKSEIESLRGEQGAPGKDGKSFIFSEHEEEIRAIAEGYVAGIQDELKLKFSDLSDEDKEQLRGPRGQRGKPGKDFVFEEYKEYFNTLKLKFSDLTVEERNDLKLKFNSLTPDEKNELRFKYSDFSESEKEEIRGPRGQRGRSGQAGEKGDKGDTGEKGDTGLRGLRGERGFRGLQGVQGPKGAPGTSGSDGRDGRDAAWITDIEIKDDGKSFYFMFYFSDGTTLRTNEIKLPKQVEVYIAGGGGGGGNNGGGSGSDFEFLSGTGVPSNSLGVDGNLYLDDSSGYLYQKIAGVWNAISDLTPFEFLFGNGVPSNAIGVEENLYLDTATNDLYKKIAGVWVFQVNVGGGGGSSNETLFNVPCDPAVFPGAVVRLVQDSPTPIFMDEWTVLALVPSLNLNDYSILANFAQANTYERANAIGIVSSKPTVNTCNIIKSGPTPDLFFGLDVTKEYFLSETSPGYLTPTAPVNSGEVIISIGKPVSSKSLEVIISDRIERA